jgi:Flp pilus assembly protein TadB
MMSRSQQLFFLLAGLVQLIFFTGPALTGMTPLFAIALIVVSSPFILAICLYEARAAQRDREREREDAND